MLIKAYEIDKNLTKQDCFKWIVKFFVKNNITTEKYFDAIIEREKQASFYIGNFVAIPHGAEKYKNEIKNNGIVIFRFKTPINWDNQKVHYVIGIAGIGDAQIDILQNIAISFCEQEKVLESLKIQVENLVDQLAWK